MATLRCGTDHYQLISASGFESEPAVYGSPCILADEDTGDILFAFLGVPTDDGKIQAAMGLGVVVYRLDVPDREEATTIEDLPDGFDFEQDEDYDSPFDTEGDEDEDTDGVEGEEGEDEDEEDGEEEDVEDVAGKEPTAA